MPVGNTSHTLRAILLRGKCDTIPYQMNEGDYNMNYLTIDAIRNLTVGQAVEVHFSDYNRCVELIKELRNLTGCGLREAVDIVRDRTMTLVVTGAQGALNVLSMVNAMNSNFAARRAAGAADMYPIEVEDILTVKFALHDTKPVYRV